MIVKKIHRLSLAIVLLAISLPQLFAAAIDDFASSSAINEKSAAILITDLKSGKTIAALNESKPLIPASIMKSVTIGTLLEKVGANYKYKTPVFYTGNLKDNIITGNLIVSASGDPSINTSNAPHTRDFVAEIVDALNKLQVKRIDGEIIVDEEEWPGPAVNPTWATGDLPHAYGTGTHGFNFEDNASGKKSVANPAATFKSRLISSLAKSGIEVGRDSVEIVGKKHHLGTHSSETIDEIMRSCMMRSDNQFAEAMLRLVGKEYGGEGSTKKGASEMMSFWKNHHANMTGVNIVDGSGLSRTNRVTANFMADVLKRLYKNPYYASFFPLAGQEGTLKKFLADTPLAGYIALKTGSMNGIQCYAGYKLDEDFMPTHSVVVIMNEMGDRAAARKQVEQLLLRTFIDDNYGRLDK